MSSVDRATEFRAMRPGEAKDACELIASVFNRFVAPSCEPEGVATFYEYANAVSMEARASQGQVLLVAADAGRLVGVLEMRDGNHLALLFVSLTGKGIARELLRLAIAKCRAQWPSLTAITVNSSPYAEPVYRKLGFTPTDVARVARGIAYIPMSLEVRGPVSSA